MYSLYIRYPDTGAVIEIPYDQPSFTEELNVGKIAQSIALDYDALLEITAAYNTSPMALLRGGLREIYFTKIRDGVETKIYYGVIVDLSFAKREDGGYNIVIASYGFFNLLEKARTGVNEDYNGVDAGQIAWGMIDTFQNSDAPYSNYGITEGTIQASKVRDRTTYQFSNIREEIIKLSNNNLKDGFDCEIDNDKRFHTYSPTKGSNREKLILDKGNIIEWSTRTPLLSSLINTVHVLGKDDLYLTRQSVATYRNSFKTLVGVISEKDTYAVDMLEDKGDKHLLQNQSPITKVSLSHADGDVDILDYNVGDRLPVTIPELGYEKAYKRVMKRTIAIKNKNLAVVSLELQ